MDLLLPGGKILRIWEGECAASCAPIAWCISRQHTPTPRGFNFGQACEQQQAFLKSLGEIGSVFVCVCKGVLYGVKSYLFLLTNVNKLRM